MTRSKRSIPIALGLTAALFLVQEGYAQKRPCSEAEARRALDEAVTLRDWDALYKSYKLYHQCDDGAIGEGYSESVARILVDRWKTLPQLDRLATKDAPFLRFVIKHLDATLNVEDTEKVKKNAKTHCPTGLQALCDKLAKQADSALTE